MRVTLALTIVLLLCPAVAKAQRGDGELTIIYFVRHGQVDPTQPTFPLSAEGHRRAAEFAQTVRGVSFTHIFSSHTTRARQTVEPVAQAMNLPIQQLPRLGSKLDTTVISDTTSSRVAIPLLVDALRRLPNGSSALVGINSDNIYAVLHGLGVPVATDDRPCAVGSSCVPCLSNACFPGGDDQLWVLILGPALKMPKLIELRYGATGNRN